MEERRKKAALRSAAYKQQVKKCFNRKVKPRNFQVGDLVLREVSLATKNPSEGKLGPNWEGPYVVNAQSRAGTYRLKTMAGTDLKHPWNAEHLKKYYQ